MKDNQDMVANSETSPQKEKPRTSKTAKLTREQALEILQQSVIVCQQVGISVEQLDMSDGTLALAFMGVVLANDRFVLASVTP